MKKVILLCSLALLGIVFTGIAQTAKTATPEVTVKKDGAKIEFETETIDYGTIENNSDGNREFKFTNTGNTPLVISNATGSCGCTVPTWPKEAIAPGKSAAIKVHYDTKRTGAFSKSVTIVSNALNEPSKILHIKGNVNAPQEVVN
jgi:hypothetical protein